MSSASAIVAVSRSKSRYHDQDLLLSAFCGHDACTAKEIAVEVLQWGRERYTNSPKRAFDLFKLGYLDKLDDRECRQTGKKAHTYRATDKGREHLRKVGAVVRASAIPSTVCDPAVVNVNVESFRQRLDDIKSLLVV